MTLYQDDPRWTAYALGELQGEDKAELDAILADSEEARLWLEELKETASILSEELRQEPCPEAAPLPIPVQTKAIKLRWLGMPRWSVMTGAAASFLIVATYMIHQGQQRRAELETSASMIRKMEQVEQELTLKALTAQQKALEANTLHERQAAGMAADQAKEMLSRLKAEKRALDGRLMDKGERMRRIEEKAPSKPVLQDQPDVSRSQIWVPLTRVPDSPPSSKPSVLPRMPERDATPHLRAPSARFQTESYDHFEENPFLSVKANPLSTFSIDVDTSSYSNVRRFLRSGSLPPRGAVRIEEMVNYFRYEYPQPKNEHPFSTNLEVAGCPWKPGHRLVRVGLKGREIAKQNRPPTNLVFLIDVSGSMQDPNKLPLIQSSMKLLAGQLTARDRVTIVVYAGAAGMVLPPTAGDRHRTIMSALDRLSAGGTTHGSEGIRQAYEAAQRAFIPGGVNRVILCTDGDFNVGVTSQDELVRIIQEKAKTGVFLSVLGFGMGNYKDSTLQKLANKGNGHAAYIDTLQEAKKVLVEQMTGTLITIAKDVKIQVEFNPAAVKAYRLLGYEKRMLRAEDFNDDRKDAGEIGAGHTVTALYEIVPNGQSIELPDVDPLKYQRESAPRQDHPEMLTLKLRYKQPDGNASRLLSTTLTDGGASFQQASTDFRFAAAVAGFGMILQDSKHKGAFHLQEVQDIARAALGEDREAYRKEFLELVQQAKSLHMRHSPSTSKPTAGTTHAADAPVKILKLAPVSYPPQAIRNPEISRNEVLVKLRIFVDETGKPLTVKVVEGPGYGFEECAFETVQKSRFQPAFKGGRPVKEWTTLTIRFPKQKRSRAIQPSPQAIR